MISGQYIVYSITDYKNKVTKNKRNVKSWNTTGAISFLDDIEPDSESISEQSFKASVDEHSVDSLEIGRKTPRKKGTSNITRKFTKTRHSDKVKTNKHKVYTAESFITESAFVEENVETNEEQETIQTSQDDAEALLDEIGKQSEKFSNNEEKGKSRFVGTNAEYKEDDSADALSILDDIFSENSRVRKRKPAPLKKCQISPAKQSKHNRGCLKSDKSNTFDALDDLFEQKPTKVRNKKGYNDDHSPIDINDNEKGNEEVSDFCINLDVSTLKDDGEFDLFDNPKLWKKRRKKHRDEGTAVDRMIADSDADYQELFTRGKMKKMEKNSEVSSPVGLNGSESLFSS